jgi:hypothetical protein
VGFAAAAGCGGDGDGDPATDTRQNGETDAATTGPDETGDGGQVDTSRPPPGSTGSLPHTAAERGAAATARAYLRALDRHDGGRVCRLLEPAARGRLDLPEDRGGCAASLDASIGHVEPGGRPQWEGVRIASAPATRPTGRYVRVTITVVQDYGDRATPSVEEDVIYVSRESGSWRLVKASATLYRAVGVAEPPLSVLAPPRNGR